MGILSVNSVLCGRLASAAKKNDEEKRKCVSMANDQAVLQLQQVTRTFWPSGTDGPRVEVLRGISLVVYPAESVSITGPSGSGKSSLLNLMGLLDQPTSGKVLLNGADTQRPEPELARLRCREIGFVFQQHYLLPQCTVWENVLVPTLAAGAPEEHVSVRAMSLLDQVGLLPHLDRRPGQLSGGECQRVAVVRALINRPRLLLADEPTGALDYSNGLNLMQLLLELNRKEAVTLIVVTHTEGFARMLGRHYQLQDGCLR